MRIIALIAVRNEQRFIAQCLMHLHSQGIETVLIDNGSTDSTIELAQQFKHYGLRYIFHHPYQDEFNLKEILTLKQQLACDLDAHWFMHQDVDEFREPVQTGKRLVDLVSEIDSQGFNAVDFMEYTFIPTAEEPNHDHAHFQDTMRWYYPFLRKPNNRTNLWKKNLNIDLVSDAGHHIVFDGINIYPQSQILRHYQILSKKHAIEKYCERKFSKAVIQQTGWHGSRPNIAADKIVFPPAHALGIGPIISIGSIL